MELFILYLLIEHILVYALVQLKVHYFLTNGVLLDTPRQIANYLNDNFKYEHQITRLDIIEFAEISNILNVTKLEKNNKINNERYKIELKKTR